MKKITLLSILFLGLYFLSGCKKDDAPDNSNSFTSCTFLKVGNKWEYIESSNNRDTVIYEVLSETNGTYKIREQWVTVNDSFFKYWFTEGSYLFNYFDGESKADAQRIFKCGASVGDTWTDVIEFGSGVLTKTHKVIETNATYSSNNITYTGCIKIEEEYVLNSITSLHYAYWHPTIGLISSSGVTLIEKYF